MTSRAFQSTCKQYFCGQIKQSCIKLDWVWLTIQIRNVQVYLYPIGLIQCWNLGVYMLSQAPIAMATRYLSTLKCYDCNSSGLLCKVPMCISTIMHAISQDSTSSFLHAGKTSPDQYYIAKLVIQLWSCQQCNPTQNAIRPRFQQQPPRQRFLGSKPFPN